MGKHFWIKTNHGGMLPCGSIVDPLSMDYLTLHEEAAQYDCIPALGQHVSREQYPDLYAAIGISFTRPIPRWRLLRRWRTRHTFQVPDLRANEVGWRI